MPRCLGPPSARLVGPLLSAAVLLLAGCLTTLPRYTPEADRPAFRPEVFFDAETHGLGTLFVRGKAPELLRVTSVGVRGADGVFRLDQTITHPDGDVETRTWLLRQVGADTYEGTLSDAAGAVRAEVQGNELHIRYRIGAPAVTMEQRLHLEPDGRTALNVSTVRVLGIPWARLLEQITRVETAP